MTKGGKGLVVRKDRDHAAGQPGVGAAGFRRNPRLHASVRFEGGKGIPGRKDRGHISSQAGVAAAGNRKERATQVLRIVTTRL